jgi:Ca-activated chloride channel family protein
MFKKVLLFCSLFVFIATDGVLAYTYLNVRNPRSWTSMQGTIEEAVISIKPKGIYMEIGLYLTFSARGWNHSPNDSLEVEFYFDLPENSIVSDSWLWIDDEIIRGEIMDKWTASQIYENIVRRRRDPSILYKRYGDSYELRIYPMLASESRKVKITYLVPTQWSATNVVAQLPTSLLKASFYELSTLYLLTWLDDKWKNPGILEFPEIQFMNKSDVNFGEYVRADIPVEAVQSSLHFKLDSPLIDGLYLSKYQSDMEGVYQMVLLPSRALNISTNSKVAILFDYDSYTSTESTQDILNSVKSELLSTFSKNDSFNLIFSQLNIMRTSDAWIPGDPEAIENIFSGLEDDPISNYSNLPSLLANGIDFIQNNGNNGSIVLISGSDNVGEYEVANQLIEDLLSLMNPKIPIHIADIQNKNFSYHNIGGRAYYGNEYFYTNISRLTSANHYSIFSGYALNELISTSLTSLSGFISNFDLYTSLKNGFCFSRYNLNRQENSIYLDRPFVQLGKYQGAFPFTIITSGVYNSTVFSENLVIDEEFINVADSLSVTAWTGNHIKNLESGEQTNSIVSDIIDFSLDNRILSKYTAFLCLEPARGGEVCYDCMDESDLIGSIDVSNTVEQDTVFKAYPNPFNNRVKIDVSLPLQINPTETQFRIYNVLGQVVRNFYVENKSAGNRYQFIWNAKNDTDSEVSTGTYIFVVNTGEAKYSLKLLFMK